MHANHSHEEKESTTRRKSRLGIRLFFVYLFFYAGFVAIGVFQYELLSIPIFGGLNLALGYGIGLIIFAVILGIIYNYLCTKYEDEVDHLEKEEGGL
ncbi:MAG: DUF485 domain-containing protein [Sphingobacteriaceae bacterium]